MVLPWETKIKVTRKVIMFNGKDSFVSFFDFLLFCNSLYIILQTPDDPPMKFNYRVDGTGVFTINPEGFVMLASDELDYETSDKITFKVEK